jgi:hypothetical protein
MIVSTLSLQIVPSLGQPVQLVAVCHPRYVPTGQIMASRMQYVCPTFSRVLSPTSHSRHAIASSVSENEFTAHGAHVAFPALPEAVAVATSTKRPAVQLWHLSLPEPTATRPVAHIAHKVCAASEARPGGHSAQLVWVSSSATNRPAAHVTHVVAPLAGVIVPVRTAEHAAQMLKPPIGANFPTAQGTALSTEVDPTPPQ